MKYIRTKDELGIYIEKDNEYKDLAQGTYFKTWRGFSLHDDWQVADTIEELCDEFVGIDKNGNHKKLPHPYFDNWTVFGAIWTDKGLIYIAKMNDKGELELL